jgi:biuret amidohydrolase
MSAFAGTPLAMALRDLGIGSFAIAGVALEIGIAPTIWHAGVVAALRGGRTWG